MTVMYIYLYYSIHSPTQSTAWAFFSKIQTLPSTSESYFESIYSVIFKGDIS